MLYGLTIHLFLDAFHLLFILRSLLISSFLIQLFSMLCHSFPVFCLLFLALLRCGFVSTMLHRFRMTFTPSSTGFCSALPHFLSFFLSSHLLLLWFITLFGLFFSSFLLLSFLCICHSGLCNHICLFTV